MKYLADKVTSFFIKKKAIAEEDRDIYVYCFELLIATVFNLLVMLVIAVSTQLYLESIIFTVVFMSMRGICGGYHANRHLTCFITVMIIFSTFITMYKLVPHNILFYISIGSIIVGIIIVCLLAPVDSVNKPLTIKEYKKNKVKSIVMFIIYTFVTSLLMAFKETRYYSFSLAYPLGIVALLLIIGDIKKRVENSTGLDIEIIDE